MKFNILEQQLMCAAIMHAYNPFQDGDEVLMTHGLISKLGELLPNVKYTKNQLYTLRRALWKEGFLKYVPGLLSEYDSGYFGSAYMFKSHYFTNVNRNRRYGLRVGDSVRHRYTAQRSIVIVASILSADNNSVKVMFPDGSYATDVAEWCELITPVEEKYPWTKECGA